MLVGRGRVVLLGHEVAEQAVRERLVTVGVDAGDVDRNRILVADVLGEGLVRLPVEDDDAHHPLETEEEIVLPALVVVEAAHHARPRVREVRLADRLRQVTRTRELREPPALVLEALQLDPAQPT